MDSVTEENARAYDAHAEDWYRAMSTNPGHIYLEKPAMERELPDDLTGVNVLSVGTGSGEELGLLVKRNPRHIVAVDISGKLLAIASRMYPDIECRNMDMMDLSFDDTSFGLVYSSLAFHYTHDWDRLLAGVYRVLKPGGTLLFSTHNPGYWSKGATGAVYTNERGVTLTEHAAVLPGGVRIVYYNHKDIASLHEAVLHAGLIIDTAYDPEVIRNTAVPKGERTKYENMVTTNAKNPLFHIVRTHRPVV